MSLDSEEPEQEQNEMKDLQHQLTETTALVKFLSVQLGDLRDKVKQNLIVLHHYPFINSSILINLFPISILDE